MESRPQSTQDLAREAARSVGALVDNEVAIAKEELQRDATEAAKGALFLGGAALGALFGLELVVLGLGGVSRHPTRSTAMGLGLLGLAGLATSIGISALPKHPLANTKSRLERDLDVAKDVLAR
jgi:hypothetical protein